MFWLFLSVFVFIAVSQIPIFLSISKKKYRPRLVQRLQENDMPLKDVLKYAANGGELCHGKNR